MLVYMLVFRYYIRFNQVDNYTIFLFCGLLPWLWLQSALLEGASSIAASGHLITKSMFPAHILPAVSVLTTLIHFILSLPLLFIFMAVSGMPMHWTMVLLPLLIVMQSLFLFGMSLTLAAVNVFFRDVQHIVGNLLTFLFFLCPILYPRSVVPERFQFTLDLNPFSVITEAYHAVILDGTLPSTMGMAYVLGWSVISVWLGSMVYRRYSESFAEML
jgi:ABC-type polysaccharide/polyol phosphate export permease